YKVTFSGTIAGSNTIAATIDGFTITSTPPSLTVTPGPASQLVFLQGPPATGTAGVSLPALEVAVEDKIGNVVTGDSSTVTLTLEKGTFASGSTTTTAQDVNGVATFSNLIFDVAGSYVLVASDGALTKATSGSTVISP